MQWINIYQSEYLADMQKKLIKLVLGTDFYSPMFWESIIVIKSLFGVLIQSYVMSFGYSEMTHTIR